MKNMIQATEANDGPIFFFTLSSDINEVFLPVTNAGAFAAHHLKSYSE